ncbi:MAG: cyclic nucleotide-binding domain-containing protein [Myxococcales bacterium]|nr:cyclic nucleotide-binding domain-containing protein [Myxococcales bacterium]HIL81104.1 cyclic nucleotide-binding domain-containing protein [Myxococcales bacterium]
MNPDDLKHFSLMAEFSEEDREALAEMLEERVLPNGKSAFREGSEAEGLVLLEKGRLKLKSGRRGGVIGSLQAPEHLGAASLFAFGKREVTALADGACTIWVLPRSGMARLLNDAPRAAYRLAEATAGELGGLLRTGTDLLSEAELE